MNDAPDVLPATVAVVDDSPDNRRLLEAILTGAGYGVLGVDDGEQALSAIAAQAPDLVLMDIRMPGLDGVEVCRRLRAQATTRDIPVIFVSALPATADKVRAFAAGGVDYLVKPFPLEEVLARVRTHISLRRMRDELKRAYDQMEARVEERTIELRESNRRIREAAQLEQAMGSLLRLSLKGTPLEHYLEGALAVLARVPWSISSSQSALFLVEGEGDGRHLRLAAGHNLPMAQRQAHERIGPSDCPCGGAATATDIRFLARCECPLFAPPPYGLYCVPIIDGGRVLGMLAQQVEPDHRRSDMEETFLRRVSDALGIGIARRYAESRLQYLAYHDDLTDLPNRRLLVERLGRDLSVARQVHGFGAVLLLDLDGFKAINDALGHRTGDLLLQETARRLGRVLRRTDTLCRWGADEFVVLLPALDRTPEHAAGRTHEVADKLCEALTPPSAIGGQELSITACIGTALFPPDGDTSEELLKHADHALNQAKADGRGTIRFFEPRMQQVANTRFELEKSLRRAIDRREFHLVYQPQVAVDGGLIGAEVLLRWQRPGGAQTSPSEFIPLAEDTGLILPLGGWVLRTAIGELAAWNRQGLLDGHLKRVAINVSSRQFFQPNFVDGVLAAAQRHGIGLEHLELEITEGTLLIDVEDTIRKMRQLKEAGVNFSIDDFGTGYSSLAYLKRLPVDRLKIDQSFVRNVHHDPQDAAIVETIISMAQHLNLEIVAEGVETADELEFLRQRGCVIYQGYHFSRPLSGETFTGLLRNGK